MLFIQDLISKQKYTTGTSYVDFSDIFIELKSSTLVSDLHGLMRHILCLIFVALYFKFTVPLIKQCVITKGYLYGVSYFYAVWLVSMNLSPTL